MLTGWQGVARVQRELVYGTARLEINARNTPRTILLNGELVQKYYFAHVQFCGLFSVTSRFVPLYYRTLW